MSASLDSWEDAAEPSQSDSPPDRWDESFLLEPDIGNGCMDILKAQRLEGHQTLHIFLASTSESRLWWKTTF